MPTPSTGVLIRRSYRLYELPAVTGLADRTIRSAIERGELKATKKSRRCTLIHVDDLDAWLNSGDYDRHGGAS
jgi:excisionase family DNA binding protein